MVRAFSDATITEGRKAAGAGYVILSESGKVIDSAGTYLGEGYTDSTRAELEALLTLLYRLETIEFEECTIYLDSLPALRALERPPEPPYGELLRRVREALSRLPGRVHFGYVPRGQNLEANRLAKRAALKDSWKLPEKPPSKAFIVKVEAEWLSQFQEIESFSDKFRYKHKSRNVYIRSHVDLKKNLGEDVFVLVTARLSRDPRVLSRRFQDGWTLQIKSLSGRQAPRSSIQEILSSLKI